MNPTFAYLLGALSVIATIIALRALYRLFLETYFSDWVGGRLFKKMVPDLANVSWTREKGIFRGHGSYQGSSFEVFFSPGVAKLSLRGPVIPPTISVAISNKSSSSFSIYRRELLPKNIRHSPFMEVRRTGDLEFDSICRISALRPSGAFEYFLNPNFRRAVVELFKQNLWNLSQRPDRIVATFTIDSYGPNVSDKPRPDIIAVITTLQEISNYSGATFNSLIDMSELAGIN